MHVGAVRGPHVRTAVASMGHTPEEVTSGLSQDSIVIASVPWEQEEEPGEARWMCPKPEARSCMELHRCRDPPQECERAKKSAVLQIPTPNSIHGDQMSATCWAQMRGTPGLIL